MKRYLIADLYDDGLDAGGYLWVHIFASGHESLLRLAFDTQTNTLISAWRACATGWFELDGEALADVEEDVIQNRQDALDDGTLFEAAALPEWAVVVDGSEEAEDPAIASALMPRSH